MKMGVTHMYTAMPHCNLSCYTMNWLYHSQSWTPNSCSQTRKWRYAIKLLQHPWTLIYT